jgi:hypothetical protein
MIYKLFELLNEKRKKNGVSKTEKSETENVLRKERREKEEGTIDRGREGRTKKKKIEKGREGERRRNDTE